MKKLFLILAVLFSGVGLAGCEYLSPEVQQKISEELCAQDPNNTLCNLDAVNNLEDTVVLTLIDNLYTKYEDGTLSDVCTDFISPSNPDLLDKCRNGEFEFIPTDITDFTPTNVTQDGDTYKVTGENNLTHQLFTIEVSVVEVDGSYYIESYTTSITNVQDVVVTEIDKDSAFVFFTAFFTDLFDSSIDNATFCAIYYDSVDEDCDGMRTDVREEYSSIASMTPMTFEGDVVSGHVTVLKMSGESEDITLDVTLKLDEMGHIKIDSIQDEGSMASELGMKAMEMTQNMLLDYLNPEISNDDFFTMYDFSDVDMTSTMRFKDAGHFTMGYVMHVFDGEMDTFVMQMQFMTTMGFVESKLLQVSMMENTDNTYSATYKFIPFDSTVSDLDEATTEITNYVSKYTDDSVSNDDFYMTYFGAGMNTDLFYNRDENRNDTFTIDSVTPSVMPGYFTVKLMIGKPDGTMIERSLEFRVNRWETKLFIDINGGIDNDCDGVCVNPDDRQELFTQLDMYLRDYLDSSITDEQLNSMYFDNMMLDSFFTKRQADITTGVTLSLYDFVGPIAPDTYYLLTEVKDGDMSMVRKDKIKVTKRVDKTTPLLLILDDDSDGDTVPLDAKVALLENYKNDNNHASMISDDMCKMYVPLHRVEACSAFKTETLQMGYHVESIELFIDQNGQNFVRIRRRPDLLTQEWDELIDNEMAFFYYNNDGTLIMELVPTYMFDYMGIMNQEVMSVISVLNDSTVSIEDLSAMVSPNSVGTIQKMRSMIDEGMVARYNNLVMINGEYQLTIDYYRVDVLSDSRMYVLTYVNDMDHTSSMVDIQELIDPTT